MNLHIPGSRVVIRDEEWLVRRADPGTYDGQFLMVDGVSDLVYDLAFADQSLSQSDNPRLPQSFWSNLTSDWTRDCALRSDYARRSWWKSPCWWRKPWACRWTNCC